MKKMLMLSLCASFVLISFAQVQKKDETPTAAKSAFATKFPKAQKIKWSVEKPGEFEAEFTINGIESSAEFDAQGKFIESETEIKESELPQTIKAAIAKDYKGFKLIEAEKALNAHGQLSYEVKVGKETAKFELVFDKEGKLLKKEAKKMKEEEKD